MKSTAEILDIIATEYPDLERFNANELKIRNFQLGVVTK